MDPGRRPCGRAVLPRVRAGQLEPAHRPGGATAIGLECYCQAEPGDPVWGFADADLAAACARALHEPLGLLDDPGDARLLEVVRLPRAYPVPDLAHLDAIRAPAEWLAASEASTWPPGGRDRGHRGGRARRRRGALRPRSSPPDDGVPHIS